MPTYEYRCKDCRHELEAQQSFDDDPLTACPSCGGALKKKFSAVGISFKGSGFYKTDSRTAGAAAKKEPAAKDSSSESSKDASSTDSSSKDSTTKAPAADSGSSGSTKATPAPAPA